MITVRTTTQVNAPIERCFQLSLSAALRQEAVGSEPVSGRTTGLIGLDDKVTWAKGLFGWGSRQENRVEALRPDLFFREVSSVESPGRLEHDHHFAPMNDGTRIRDEIQCSAPEGWRGLIAERFFLRRRMTEYLKRRNAIIKQAAESEGWHHYLDGELKLEEVGPRTPRPEAIHAVSQSEKQRRAAG
jgi:ligand-binding SRPBCC domain-containing protein